MSKMKLLGTTALTALKRVGLGAAILALGTLFTSKPLGWAANISFPPGYTPPATAVYTPSNPTAPASTSAFAMQGLGSYITPITPSGSVDITIQATLTDSATTVGEGIILKLYTIPIPSGGSCPANAANVPGSAVQVGAQVEWATGVTLTTAADLFQPLYIHGVARGLTPGQQYCIDVAAESVTTASAVALTNVTVVLKEIG